MNRKPLIMSMLICLGLFNPSCHSQDNKSDGSEHDRKPAVAGQFYSKDPVVLRKNIMEFFASAVPRCDSGTLRALIVPHAGYVFSGQVAASGFNQIPDDAEYKRVFLIGSSHTTHFDGASVYAEGSFETPLGKVAVDTAAAAMLIKQGKVFSFMKDVHWYEHSLEVEIPFLQVKLRQDFQLIPIVLGGSSLKTIKQVAEALKPWFEDPASLFVISTDFSHYPSYQDACSNDRKTMEAILKNDPERLREVMEADRSSKMAGLSTSLCGWTSVMSLLYLTQGNTELKYTHLQYMNSGDSPYGDSNRVVGYHAIALFSQATEKEDFVLDKAEKNLLLSVARRTLEAYIREGKKPDFSGETFPAALQQNCGAFVSLHKNGKLRGCIGRFTSDIPLFLVVRDMAIASATQDLRFPRVSKEEVDEIDIEISVLSPMRKVSSADEIELGVHGIYIIKDGHAGTFLPQVATETGWSKEEFLGHCARDKAGIGWDGWKTAEIYVYTAIVFGEKEEK